MTDQDWQRIRSMLIGRWPHAAQWPEEVWAEWVDHLDSMNPAIILPCIEKWEQQAFAPSWSDVRVRALDVVRRIARQRLLREGVDRW